MSGRGSGYGTLMAFVAGGIVTVGATAAVSALTGGKKKKERQIEAAPTSKSRSLMIPGIGDVSMPAQTADDDHVNFLSDIMNRLWPYITEAGSAMIRETVEPMFPDMMPSALSSLHFTKVDLGMVPIRMDNVIVHELKDGQVQWDMDIIWESESDIQLKADYIGSLGVKSIIMKGRMTFTMRPLTNILPIVGAIQYAFINPPELELDFTGLANVADFSVGSIAKSVRTMMQDILASMVVLPNRMTSKLDVCDFRDFYQSPFGVARVTCMHGRGFVVEKKTIGRDDIPDVYCKVKLGCEAEWKTTVVKDSLCPEWKESNDFMLSDNDQIISIEAWDEDTGTMDADDFLGSAQVTVRELLLAGKTMEVALQQDKKENGAFITLRCDVFRFGTDLASMDKIEPNQLGGLLTIIVTQAKNIPLDKKDASTFVKVLHGDNEVGVTGVVVDDPGYDALNPVYDMAFRVPIASAEEAKKPVTFQLMNGTITVLGGTIVQYADLGKESNAVVETRALGDGASLDISVTLMGVSSKVQESISPKLSEALGASSSGKETVLVSVLRGHGWQAKKKGRFKKADIPDIYVQVKYGSSPTVWTTKTMKNQVAPEWNESKEYAMSSNNQVISIEAYDANKRGKDDFVGSARITVGKVLIGGGSMELELTNGATKTGTFIVIGCDRV